jgi:hypothetical protein
MLTAPDHRPRVPPDSAAAPERRLRAAGFLYQRRAYPHADFLFCSARWAGSGLAWRSRSLLLGLVEHFIAHTGGGIAVFYVIFQWSRRRSGLHRNDVGREADAPQDGRAQRLNTDNEGPWIGSGPAQQGCRPSGEQRCHPPQTARSCAGGCWLPGLDVDHEGASSPRCGRRLPARAAGPTPVRLLQPKVDHAGVPIAVLIGWLALPVWVRGRMRTA